MAIFQPPPFHTSMRGSKPIVFLRSNPYVDVFGPGTLGYVTPEGCCLKRVDTSQGACIAVVRDTPPKITYVPPAVAMEVESRGARGGAVGERHVCSILTIANHLVLVAGAFAAARARSSSERPRSSQENPFFCTRGPRR